MKQFLITKKIMSYAIVMLLLSTAIDAQAQNSNNIGNGLFSFPLTVPYAYDFENGLQGWHDSVANSGTQWQTGTPSWHAIQAAHSGVNAWMTNINSGYDDDALCYLYSPFFDFSNVDSLFISFWQNIKTEKGGSNWDGARLDYSVDGGITWQALGGFQDPNGVNWYNSPSISSTSLPGWSGNSESLIDFPNNNHVNGWMKSVYDLTSIPDLNYQVSPVQFRFLFTSDMSVNAITYPNYSGQAIDDITIDFVNNNVRDMAMVSIKSPKKIVMANSTQPVIVTVRNDGPFYVTSFNLLTSIRNGAGNFVNVNMTPWSGLLFPLSTIDIVLPSVQIPAGPFTICVEVQIPGDIPLAAIQYCINAVNEKNKIVGPS